MQITDLKHDIATIRLDGAGTTHRVPQAVLRDRSAFMEFLAGRGMRWRPLDHYTDEDWLKHVDYLLRGIAGIGITDGSASIH